jgi:hypothetical protein
LLDRHLATFDGWLQAQLRSLSASSWPYYYLAIVTLLDQLDPKEYNWLGLSMILRDLFRVVNLPFIPEKLRDLFGGTKYIEFSRIVSKFLMERDRAGFFWVNPQTYVILATQFLKILRDK